MEAVLTGQIVCVKEIGNLNGVDWATKNADQESLEDVDRKENQGAVLYYLQLRNNETPLGLGFSFNEENRDSNEVSEELGSIAKLSPRSS